MLRRDLCPKQKDILPGSHGFFQYINVHLETEFGTYMSEDKIDTYLNLQMENKPATSAEGNSAG